MVIYAIPGLGLTEKLYENIVVENVKLIVLKWPLSEEHDTVQSYARKFLPQINTEQPFCLLGVSFGGMLCCELSKIISPKKLFLVSTSKSRNELPWTIRTLKHIPIHKLISEKYHRVIAHNSLASFGIGKASFPEYIAMIDSMQGRYFKNTFNMMVNWNRKEFPVNYIHIHGNDDKMLMYRYVKVDHTINQGSHAIIIFQAAEINKIIESAIKVV